jgi:hypothetical protein
VTTVAFRSIVEEFVGIVVVVVGFKESRYEGIFASFLGVFIFIGLNVLLLFLQLLVVGCFFYYGL